MIEIARCLDGVPLALELAATRVATMGPVEVAGRIDRRFTLLTHRRLTALPRHHAALQTTVGWSFACSMTTSEQCPSGSQCSWAGSPWTPLSGSEPPPVTCALKTWPTPSLPRWASRCSASMTAGPRPATRWRRSCARSARNRWVKHGGLALSNARTPGHYIELAWQAERGLRGPHEREWVGVLDAERGNLGAAHAWALRPGNPRIAAELSAALYGSPVGARAPMC